MAIPNLICLLWLSKDIADETFAYEKNVVALEKKGETASGAVRINEN